MGRMGNFFLGIIVGAVLVYTGLKYHVVRASDGVHFVPKLSAEFREAYVDIRGFSATDWEAHPSLAVAIMKAEKGHLFQNSASETFRRGVDSVLQTLSGRKEAG